MATSKQKSDLENLANINDINNSKIPEAGSWRLKGGLAQMLKGGVIMDVTNKEQAKIAENAGACAVMALERIPADIRKDGGISRMSDPKMIAEIIESVSIPIGIDDENRFIPTQKSQVTSIISVDISLIFQPSTFPPDPFAPNTKPLQKISPQI